MTKTNWRGWLSFAIFVVLSLSLIYLYSDKY